MKRLSAVSGQPQSMPSLEPHTKSSGLARGVAVTWRGEMTSKLKFAAAIACGMLVGGSTIQLLHAQAKPAAFVIAEITVTDEAGYDVGEKYAKFRVFAVEGMSQ
jgi:hypothetical protein